MYTSTAYTNDMAVSRRGKKPELKVTLVTKNGCFLEIGELFMLERGPQALYKVTKGTDTQSDCTKCAMHQKDICINSTRPACTWILREDGKSVYFEEYRKPLENIVNSKT